MFSVILERDKPRADDPLHAVEERDTLISMRQVDRISSLEEH